MANRKKITRADRHVGRRLRHLRNAEGYSAEELGKLIKPRISKQQVLKFETGQDRMTVGQLWQCAKVLEVGVNAFFNGL